MEELGGFSFLKISIPQNTPQQGGRGEKKAAFAKKRFTRLSTFNTVSCCRYIGHFDGRVLGEEIRIVGRRNQGGSFKRRNRSTDETSLATEPHKKKSKEHRRIVTELKNETLEHDDTVRRYNHVSR
jgi:hypothetical protein